MITKQELLDRVSGEPTVSQFVRFLLDGTCPTDIPKQHDENAIALKLACSVATDDAKAARATMAELAQRQPQKSSHWVSNDMLFVAMAIASSRFNAEKDFVHSLAVLRDEVSAGGAHKGLAQAVMALTSGGTDFTADAGIFSFALGQYKASFSPGAQDVLAAFDSYQSYNPHRHFETPVTLALAVKGFRDILFCIEMRSDRKHLHSLHDFARLFPARVTRVSRCVAWLLTFGLAAVFTLALLNAKSTHSGWRLTHSLLTSGLGLSSLWAVLSLIPAAQRRITNAILWTFGYPKADASTDADS